MLIISKMKTEHIMIMIGIVTAAVATYLFVREARRAPTETKNKTPRPPEKKEKDRDPTESELQGLVDKFKGR